ncbi:VOC family protein [Paraburkholderia sp. J63]|uniref:VOC family protein n=1 Tax=Paraburkholderia sp. J63 TaxID=2805434 RepID=UPI002ABD5806|nr:VOC family protein [Paraburkholderia sp. J63]
MNPYRYRKLGYLMLNVTDLDASLRFYRDHVGLSLTRTEPGLAYLRCSSDDHNLILRERAAPGLERIAFELESLADLDAARRALEADGVAVECVDHGQCRALRQGTTLRYRIPGVGLLIELYCEMARADAHSPGVAQIERLGHVVVHLREARAAIDWLVDHAGFRVSDRVGERLTFLRAFPNPYHHAIGIATSNFDGLHHVNFMVKDIDDLGRATNRLREAGIEIVYGPGRHKASGSIFLYFLDPDGMTAEYSFGMEEFPEIDPRAAQTLPPTRESADLWGGVPAQTFARVGCLDLDRMPSSNA